MKSISIKSIVNLFCICLFSLVVTSCETEDGVGYGRYIISVSNYTEDAHDVSILIDDEIKGYLHIRSLYSVSWSTTSPCDDLVQTANMDNVIVLNLIPNGSHSIQVIETSSNFVMIDDQFSIDVDECAHQPYIIN